jgi:hypothetical protein
MKHVSSASLALGAAAVVLAVAASAACTTTTVTEVAPAPDSGAATTDASTERPTTRVEGKSGSLFDGTAKSYATVDDETGAVVTVGFVVPVKAFSSAPAGAPFQDDLVLEMPKVARDQTILNHVRVNWLADGHGPSPYGEPHFDMHFQRGTIDEVDVIDCKADKRLPPATALPEGYGAPELCVNAMGMHSWPKADKGSTWTGSIIMGYWATQVSFIEPMISKAKLLEKATFELPIGKPQSTGGAKTLYPRRLTARYEASDDTYSFEFGDLEEID